MWTIFLHSTLRSVTSIEALFTDLLFFWQKLTGTVLEKNARIGKAAITIRLQKCPFEFLCSIDFLCYKVCGVRAFISFSQRAFPFQLAQCNNLTKQMYFQKNKASLTPQMLEKGFISEYTKSVRTMPLKRSVYHKGTPRRLGQLARRVYIGLREGEIF